MKKGNETNWERFTRLLIPDQIFAPIGALARWIYHGFKKSFWEEFFGEEGTGNVSDNRLIGILVILVLIILQYNIHC